MTFVQRTACKTHAKKRHKIEITIYPRNPECPQSEASLAQVSGFIFFPNINNFQLCNISVELIPETGATTTGGEVETTSTTTTAATSPLCWQCCIRNTCHTTTTHCVYLCWLSWNHHLVQVSAGSVDRPRSAGDPGSSPWSPGVSACSVSDQYRGHQRYSSPH